MNVLFLGGTSCIRLFYRSLFTSIRLFYRSHTTHMYLSSKKSARYLCCNVFRCVAVWTSENSCNYHQLYPSHSRNHELNTKVFQILTTLDQSSNLHELMKSHLIITNSKRDGYTSQTLDKSSKNHQLPSLMDSKRNMGWLQLVGSLKLYVSLAEYHLFYRARQVIKISSTEWTVVNGF